MNHPLTLTRKKTGLVVVDVQEKFKPVIVGFEEVVQNIVKLILGFQLYELPILVTEQYPQGLGNTIEDIQLPKTATTIEKIAFSCTDSDQFMDHVRP